MLRRYPSRLTFTWESTRWLAADCWALVEEEKRRKRVNPIKSMPSTATAVKDADKIIWMLVRR